MAIITTQIIPQTSFKCYSKCNSLPNSLNPQVSGPFVYCHLSCNCAILQEACNLTQTVNQTGYDTGP